MGLFDNKTFERQFGEAFYGMLMREIQAQCDRFHIRPVYAGVFGSQAKGYAGPESDIDLYVVYLGGISQYARMIPADTRQVAEEESVPPQVTLSVLQRTHADFTVDEKEVQLNFVSLDFFVREIGKGNLDFRIGHDNLVIDFMGNDALTKQIDTFAASTFDAERYRHSCAGRASKARGLMKSGGEIKHSEISDAIYRLFLGWAVTSQRFVSELVLNKTLTLAELIDGYLQDVGQDVNVSFLQRNMLPHLRDGLFKNGHSYWHPSCIRVIDKLHPLVLSRPVIIVPPHLADRSMENYLKQINRLNTRFAEMLLEGGK
jgi:predicted nucleotidyltransferase